MNTGTVAARAANRLTSQILFPIGRNIGPTAAHSAPARLFGPKNQQIGANSAQISN
jgi:hypothetical protein